MPIWEFWRLAQKDKKAFPSDQCKEKEGNNRMEKIRYLFKKIRYQGNISCKDGHKRERNGMNLKDAEDIKKRWQEYTEELYKKDLHDLDNHNGVITHLDPDILECEVKYILGSITMNKINGSDGIPVELFQILNDETILWKCHYASKFGKPSSSHRTRKGQFSLQSQRKAMPKNVQTIAQLHSSHTLAK